MLVCRNIRNPVILLPPALVGRWVFVLHINLTFFHLLSIHEAQATYGAIPPGETSSPCGHTTRDRHTRVADTARRGVRMQCQPQ